MKIKLLMLLAIFLVVSTFSLANPGYDIVKVEANGIIAQQNGDAVFVERDSRLPIKVDLKGLALTDNVRVRAWVGGYEYGKIEDESGIFEVEPGVLYRKFLILDIPEDILASDDYTLHIEAFDDDFSVEKKYMLRVSEVRHRLDIMDILIRPNIAEAGRPVFITARLENLGQKKEENIKITAQIKSLGVSASTYIDELTNFEIANKDEETSESTNEIMMFLPRDAKTGVYPLELIVEYDRGYEILVETFSIKVNGIQEIEKKEDLIKIEPKSRTTGKQSTTQYRVMIANFGTKAKTYNLEVMGTDLFADFSVNPNQVTIYPDETKQYLITLKTKDLAGNFDFVVKVKEDNKVVKEETLNLKIVESKIDFGVLATLIILIAVVVLLLIVIAFRAYSIL